MMQSKEVLLTEAEALAGQTPGSTVVPPGPTPLIREGSGGIPIESLFVSPPPLEQARGTGIILSGSEGKLVMMPGDGGSAFVDFRSVVKVLTTVMKPDYVNPWQTQGIEKDTGSGVAFLDRGKKRVLTAAHVVAHHTFVQVQRTGVETPDKYVATVAAIWHDCDLAILDVEDPDFWEDLTPTRLGKIPEIRSIVLVAGFPVGGGELSVTEGVVSRIEDQPYSHTRRRLLAVSVDAAINPGNSGGPVFNLKGELIGIAFQHLLGASNIGYVIPPPIIEHFLEGVTSRGPDRYGGFPGMGFEQQSLSLENPYLRKHLNLTDDVRGVLVTKVLYRQTCEGVLESQDVVTHVAGQPVANNGTISYGEYGRVSIDIAFSMMQVGSPIELEIVRKGKPMTVTAYAKPYQRLIPYQFQFKRPPYFVYCGLVFQPLSLDYINYTGANNPNYVSLFIMGRQKKNWKRAIVLSQVLSDNVNIGYEALVTEKILKVNGEEVADLVDLVQKVESTTEPTVRFESCCDDVIILPSPVNLDAQAANERICSRYAIGKDRYLDEDGGVA